MVAEQTADEVALRIGPRTVDHPRYDRDDRQTAYGAATRDLARQYCGTLIFVRFERATDAGWRQRQEGGRDDDATRPLERADVQQRLEAADVDAVELGRVAPPHADQRRRMNDTVPRTARRHARWSRTSPATAGQERSFNRSALRANTVGWWPRRVSLLVMARPRYPVPPVTSTFTASLLRS